MAILNMEEEITLEEEQERALQEQQDIGKYQWMILGFTHKSGTRSLELALIREKNFNMILYVKCSTLMSARSIQGVPL